MAAQDFDALYNFEDQIETAIAAVLVAALAATPTPITKTRAGAMVPAAVIIIGMARPKVAAASITAL